MGKHVNNDTPAFPWIFPGNRVYFFRANNRFVREIEQNDPEDRPYTECIFGNDGTMEYWYQLFWALTITHRTWEDPGVTFEEFLEMLPHGVMMTKLQTHCMRIISEYFRQDLKPEEDVQPVNVEEEADEGNLPPAPSEPVPPTGDSSTD